MFKKLDHIAIVVRDTEEALKFYRDTLGLPVAFSQEMTGQGVILTHLDMGNTHLQLVQPLNADHPLSKHLDEYGEGLHHFCFYVDDVPEMIETLPQHGIPSRDPSPRNGPNGRDAIFLDPAHTRGVLIELTADPVKDDKA